MLVDKLQVIEDKFMDLEQRISDPEVIARQDEWRKLTRQHAQLSETVETFRTYKKVLAGIDEAMEVIEDKSMDEEFREMAQEELKELKPQKEGIRREIAKFFYCLRTLMMIKTLSLKFAVVLAVMKRHYSQATCSACTQNMRKAKAGVVRLSMLMNQNLVDLKRLFSL